MTNIKTRDFTVDLIKTIAILGVIIIHTTSSTLTGNAVGSFEWISGLFWGTVSRASVPLFLMASGAIMLNSTKEISFKKLYLHNIARIVAAMLVWGFAYKVFHLLEEGQLNPQMLLYSVKRLLLFDHEFHFYYMHLILIVYALLPLTRFFVDKADKKLVQYALVIWAALAIVLPTLRNFKPFSLLSGTVNEWALNLTYAAVGYGVLGHYLKQYRPTLKTGIVSLVAGFLIIFCGTFYMSGKGGILNEIFLQGTSIGVCLFAVGIFSVAAFIPLKGLVQRLVVYISKASFCIYLSHMFILYIVQKMLLPLIDVPAVIMIPLCSAAITAVCIVVYAVISKIPVLNKWIV